MRRRLRSFAVVRKLENPWRFTYQRHWLWTPKRLLYWVPHRCGLGHSHYPQGKDWCLEDYGWAASTPTATHDALLLVKHSIVLPKLLHCLRTAPCFLSPGLQVYNDHFKAIVREITNIHFPNESPSWSQATLPVRSGQVQCLLSEVTAHEVHLRGCGVGYKKHCASTTISLSDFNRCLHWPSALYSNI